MTDKEQNSISLNPDRPIQRVSEDRLGFGILAQNLAKSILSAGTKEGFVIGIEGAWGCGKSSILNLVCNELEGASNISIVRFLPWIVGNRDSMVSSLISSLSSAIEEVEKKKEGSGKKALKKGVKLADKLRQYGAQAGRAASPFAGAAALLTGVGVIKEAVDALSSIDQKQAEPISDLKDELIKELGAMDHTFLVVIDDIDRLEPDETVEITRLVRAVGDFPNVTYVLCYDKKALCKSLEAALKIESGSSYLQKIVQASFAVPKPEEFDLRRWLNEECHSLHYAVTKRDLSEQESDRLRAGCDSQGEVITTPREVHLILNSLRLYYPPVAEKVDFADLCWLHIIKIKNERFYEWIEGYLSAYSVVFNREGSVSSKSHKEMAKELRKSLKLKADDKDDYTSHRSLWGLRSWLPGIADGNGGKPEGIIFDTSMTKDDLAQLERDSRLASPNHYRLYFAFSQPSGILDDARMASIIKKTDDIESTVGGLEELIKATRAQGGTLYEVFIDRLARYDIDSLGAARTAMLVHAVAETIDEGMRHEREAGFWGSKTLGSHARVFLAKALAQSSVKDRKALIKKLFDSGKSIGWLMSDIVGTELFAHGRVGNQSNADKAILDKAELDAAIKTLHVRLSKSESDSILSVPNPLHFLYRWKQSGDEKNLNKWIKEVCKTDEGFLRFLEMCRGWTASSEGVYHPLRKRDLSAFIDADAARKRVQRIAKKLKNTKMRKAAEQIALAISQGDWRDTEDQSDE